LRRLWESKEELDRRVEERTAQLRVAQQQAQAASDAKTEFLANLGHEVHTPLQTILAALELATPTAEAERIGVYVLAAIVGLLVCGDISVAKELRQEMDDRP
jgi:signal transduction histidine kinase